MRAIELVLRECRVWDRNGNLVLDTAFHNSGAEPSGGVAVAFDGQSITRLTS
jgi:hypothetical protein